jgi:ABC-type multidrug transport system ATPase subunit
VDGVTFEIRAGEVLGLAGPNGAGKSSIIAMLLGYQRPTEGHVTIDGRAPRDFIAAEGIGYLSELVAVPPLWTVKGALKRYAILDGISAADIRQRVAESVDRLGLGEHRKKRVRALSKGNLQRLGLAQAIQHDHRVVILDEPTHGLDPVWTQRFRDLVGELRAPDRAILIASHNLDELERVADRVAIIDRGKIQRIVEVRHGINDGPTVYRLVVAGGADAMPTAVPEAIAGKDGVWTLAVADLAALNRAMASAIAAGVIFAAVMPAESALEQQFREAVSR